MKSFSKNILLLSLLPLIATIHAESRDEFVGDINIEINIAADKSRVLDDVIAILLQSYVLSRVYHEGLAREAGGYVDENGQTFSDDEMDYRIGYLEAKRRILRAELARPQKSLNQFLGQSGPFLAAIPQDLIDLWKDQALQLAPDAPEA